MSKKIGIYCVCALLFFGLMFSGCSSDMLSISKGKISDVRNNYFQGQTDNWYVSFSSGVRESPYVLDGVSRDKVEFGVVTIMPKNAQKQKSFTYIVGVNDLEYSGEFEACPFDESYAGDIAKQVADDAVIFVTITDGGKEEVANMTCVSCGFAVSAEKALEFAVNEVGTELQELKKNQDFEVYIKIVADITQVVEGKYWFVMFLCESGDSINVLINPTTGECEIKKIG